MTPETPEGMTHEDRLREIDLLAAAAGTKRDPHYRAHIDRLLLIYAPFPVVRRLGTGSAMPWAGTIIGDTFYGDGITREAVRRSNATEWREISGDSGEWDDYVAACALP